MTNPQTNTSNAIALEAIQEALQKPDLPLHDSLQQDINRLLNQALENPQTEAVENLINLVQQYEPLYKEYRAIRKNLFKEYQAQQRNKGFPPQNKDIPPKTTPNILDNFVAPTPTSNEPSLEAQGQANTTTKGQKSSE
jgi:hypothetical protein